MITEYIFDVAGNRTSQTVTFGAGLTQVIASTAEANVTRTVHAPHGVFAQKDSAGNWEWFLLDGLGYDVPSRMPRIVL